MRSSTNSSANAVRSSRRACRDGGHDKAWRPVLRPALRGPGTDRMRLSGGRRPVARLGDFAVNRGGGRPWTGGTRPGTLPPCGRGFTDDRTRL
jgi:hypothetical protein